MKSFDEFIKEVNGKSFDYDHVSGIQCVDLIKRYLKECFGITIPLNFGNAEKYWNEEKELLKDFEKIPNTPSFVPKKGDIMVWNKKRGKGAGHIAICTGEGDTHSFYSYDLNWNNKKIVQKVKHDYKNVYGVLRKKKEVKENKKEFKQGDFCKIEVKFTGAINSENALVELYANQFWIGLNEFYSKDNKYFIIGRIAFIKEFTSGIAFNYFEKGIKREFQIEVENKLMEGIS